MFCYRRNDTATTVPGLVMMTEESKKVFEKGKQRLQQRKLRAATSLDVHPPLPEEMHIIHDLYLKSKLVQEANEFALLHATLPSDSTLEGKFVWMKSLVFKNSQIMHIQVGDYSDR